MKLFNIFLATSILTVFFFTANAQKVVLKVGDNTGRIKGKSVLELESTTKGTKDYRLYHILLLSYGSAS